MAEMTAAEAFNVLNNKSCRIVFKAKNGVSYELREGLSEDIAALIEQQAQEIAKLTEVAKTAEEFCQTAVYVQSQYSDDGSTYVKTSMDAVSKLNYFVKRWLEKEAEGVE